MVAGIPKLRVRGFAAVGSGVGAAVGWNWRADALVDIHVTGVEGSQEGIAGGANAVNAVTV